MIAAKSDVSQVRAGFSLSTRFDPVHQCVSPLCANLRVMQSRAVCLIDVVGGV